MILKDNRINLLIIKLIRLKWKTILKLKLNKITIHILTIKHQIVKY